MTARRDLGLRLEGLDDIREIMGAMKTMALLEIRKLSRFIACQQRVARSLDAVAADFLHAHPQPAMSETAGELCVLIGSERGFCGDFNGALLDAFDAHQAAKPAGCEIPLIAVGYRLGMLLERRPQVLAQVAGATVAEEVEPVLIKLMDALTGARAGDSTLRLTVIHQAAAGGVQVVALTPFRHHGAGPRSIRAAPMLYLQPDAFLSRFTGQYLSAQLQQMFFDSLMAESQRRQQHMEQAIQHLDEQCTRLQRRRNALRQEEITEEIEIILLNELALPGP